MQKSLFGWLEMLGIMNVGFCWFSLILGSHPLGCLSVQALYNLQDVIQASMCIWALLSNMGLVIKDCRMRRSPISLTDFRG